MQKNNFDLSSKLVIKYAGEYALNETLVDIEHFLLGILKENTSYASKVLIRHEVTEEKLLAYIQINKNKNMLFSGKTIDLSSDAMVVIEKSLEFSSGLAVSPDHLLMGILTNPSLKTIKLLNTFNLNSGALLDELSKKSPLPNYISFRTDTKRRGLESKILNQYGKELVSLAKNNLLDPLIGREKEIESLICILSRRRKNNPAIVGEAGVGKTAIVEGLAYKIARGDVPLNLADKKIVSLDLSAIIAGTKYRGEFEDRVKNIADECVRLRDVILFIDELHIIMGAGGAEGAIDAANILKPALSRGQIQIIGATTTEEYRKNVEKDSALERRFQKIIVSEPSQKQTVDIISGIKTHFETFHKVKISQNAINSAVMLSERYLTDRKLPDKAIDLIDEACAAFNLKNITQKYKTEISSIIDSRDIEDVVSKYTGIDSFNLTEDTTKSIEFLQNTLNQSIIGQDEAVLKIVSAIKRSKVGINDPNRPLGSFIFLGPTGVGKTEICKTLSKGLFKNEKSIIKIDMSEFMDKSSVTKLVGASAGYVGYGESPSILEKVRNNPYSVVLFDEIEKAHPDVLNLLLQVLEDGIITDSLHRKINFKNCIVIMTSNIGADKILNARLGFLHDVKNIKQDALSELKRIFKPEFINRVDEIIVFNKLSQENIEKICHKMLANLQERVASHGYSLIFSQNLVEHISKTSYCDKFGARPIRRFITDHIENPLTDKIINGEFSKGDIIDIDFCENISFIKN